MENIHFRTSYLETEIRKSYGANFENLASYIMCLIDPSFHPTRNHSDSGVDGIKIVGEGRTVYSAYGPEETTKWKKAKDKLNQDASDAKKFLEEHKKKLRRWCILLNRNLSGDEYELIWSAGKAHGINEKDIVLLTPKRLVALIEQNGFTIAVARFLGLISYRDLPFSDLQPHAAAWEILQRLIQIREESVEAKREELSKILDGIMSITYLYSEKSGPLGAQDLIEDIKTNTAIGERYAKAYAYSDGVFKELYMEKVPLFQLPVSVDDRGTIVITVWNLRVIYNLVRALVVDIESYNIEKLLKSMSHVHIKINLPS